jgi:hypothetical protein
METLIKEEKEMRNNHNQPDTAEIVQEEQPEVEISEPKPLTKVHGTVTDCINLNVRATPEPDGDIVAVIQVLTPVEIDLEASTETFYKICTAAGIEGFCAKQYILPGEEV